MSRSFDAIVIGAGQAGPPLVGRLATSGKTVALIERKLIGGTCVNMGCTPTKALVASAYAARTARRAAEYGVAIGGAVGVDMKAVMERARGIARHSRESNESWLGSLDRCTVIHGHASFVSPREVHVGDDVLTSDQIFLNVGGRAVVPELPGVDRIPYLTNTSILELETLPRHLVVIGGSYVGLEFAQIFRRFGSDVTVIEKGARLVAREDEDISSAIKAILQAEGIVIRLNAECIRFDMRGEDVVVGVDCSTGAPEIIGSHVLLAVGRRPNTDDLGLDRAGVTVDARGFIVVDDQLRTNVGGIWAMGDCNRRGAFTHTAYNDFEIVAANVLENDPRRVSDRIEAYALYTDPPLGRVGMTERAARAAGHTTRVGTRPMTRVARAIEKGETSGFMKMVVDAESGQMLGAAILGVGGDEAIHAVLEIMYARAPYATLQRSVPIHPTVAELIPTVLGELKP